jgi:hypothetical protein
MRAARCGFVLHDDIASSRCGGGELRSFPALQVTLGRVNLSMFD